MMAATATTILLSVAFAAADDYEPGLSMRMRSLRDIPFPRTVEEGIALHAAAMRRSRRTARLHGHRRAPTTLTLEQSARPPPAPSARGPIVPGKNLDGGRVACSLGCPQPRLPPFTVHSVCL